MTPATLPSVEILATNIIVEANHSRSIGGEGPEANHGPAPPRSDKAPLGDWLGDH
jgi:hypothetical protein